MVQSELEEVVGKLSAGEMLSIAQDLFAQGLITSDQFQLLLGSAGVGTKKPELLECACGSAQIGHKTHDDWCTEK